MLAPLTGALPILHVTTVHQPLDTRIYYKEVLALAHSGYDVRLATTVETAERRDGVSFIPLGSREGSRLRRIFRDMRALRTILSHRDAIVHIHDPELLIVAALPALFGARIVYDVHEFYVERIGASQWLPPFLRRAAAGIYDLIERAVLPRCAGIVVVSEQMAPRYARMLPSERIALVRNFPNIDAAEIERARRAPHPLDGRPYAIHTGGASGLRAFDVLVEAAEELRARASELTIVNLGAQDLSDYDESTRRHLLERARRADVHMLGSVSYQESQRWLAHATIGYLPLSDTENNRRGMPNKLFEYALFGLPIVATDIGRIAEILRESGAGLLVPLTDGKAHGEALARLHRDLAFHRTVAAASKASSQRYSFAGEFAQLRDLYARISAEAS